MTDQPINPTSNHEGAGKDDDRNKSVEGTRATHATRTRDEFLDMTRRLQKAVDFLEEREGRWQQGLPLAYRDMNSVDVVRLLVEEYSADLEAEDEHGWTPLHAAAVGNSVDVVRLLVDEYSADVNSTDADGWTPLHHVATGNHTDTAILLIDEYRADVHKVENNGATSLHVSCLNNSVDVTRVLISNGADLLARTNNSMTPKQIIFS